MSPDPFWNFHKFYSKKPAKNRKKPEKTGKNRKKPEKTGSVFSKMKKPVFTDQYPWPLCNSLLLQLSSLS